MHKRFTLIAGLAALDRGRDPRLGRHCRGNRDRTRRQHAVDRSLGRAEGPLQEDGLPGGAERRGEDRDDRRGGVPSPAVHDVIDFDQNLSLATKGLPTCNAAAAAEHDDRSGRSGLRQGEDRQRLGDHAAAAERPLHRADQGHRLQRRRRRAANRWCCCTPTAPRRSRPPWSWSAPSPTSARKATARASTSTIPPIAGGAGVITDFKVKIQKSWTYKGKKMSFVNARCPASKKLKYRGAFTYADGTTIEAAHDPELHAEARTEEEVRQATPAGVGSDVQLRQHPLPAGAAATRRGRRAGASAPAGGRSARRWRRARPRR